MHEWSSSLKSVFQNPGKIWELYIEKAIVLSRVWPCSLEQEINRLFKKNIT